MAIPQIPNKFSTYLGIMVEATSQKDQRWYHIYVPEMLPTASGVVAKDMSVQNIEVENVFTNSVEKTSVQITRTIYADYFGISSNQSVPVVAIGQQVLVINYGNTDKYYWLPLERNEHLKTFDYVKFSAVDKPVINKTKLEQYVDPETGEVTEKVKAIEEDDIETKQSCITDDDIYFLEIDTKYKKHIKLSTAKTDGEKFRYFFEIDTIQNTVELWDEPSTQEELPFRINHIKIESLVDEDTKPGGRITIENAEGNALIFNRGDLILRVCRNAYIDIAGNVFTNIKGNVATHINETNNLIIDKTSSELVRGAKSTIVEDTNTLNVIKGNTIYADEMLLKVNNTYTEQHTQKNIVNSDTVNLSTKNLNLNGSETYKLTTKEGNITITNMIYNIQNMSGKGTIITGDVDVINVTGRSIDFDED